MTEKANLDGIPEEDLRALNLLADDLKFGPVQPQALRHLALVKLAQAYRMGLKKDAP